jgi:type VI secretion system protein ImpM
MPGFYGKLPGKGDFLTRHLPRQFVDVWDEWLQSGMNESRQALGDDWLQIYLTSPLWRFVLPPGTCGDSGWAGVMMPSMDRVGRYFPMTVATELTAPVFPLMVAGFGNPWFDSVENCLLEALDNEALNLDQFAEELESYDISNALANAPALDNAVLFGSANMDRGVRSPLGDDLNIGSALIGVTVGVLQDTLASCGVWWGRGSERIAPSLVFCRGLPDPGKFPALLDGRWSDRGWSDSTMPSHSLPDDPLALVEL